MRGKKSDIDFISNFIVECAQLGKNSPNEILKEAQNELQNIDNKIKEVEFLKIRRSKLMDVVYTFNTEKVKKEPISLQLFNIKNHHICKKICLLIKDAPFKLNDISTMIEINYQDILFCIKQLLEYKVLCKAGEVILRGDKFEEYIKTVLQEN